MVGGPRTVDAPSTYIGCNEETYTVTNVCEHSNGKLLMHNTIPLTIRAMCPHTTVITEEV